MGQIKNIKLHIVTDIKWCCEAWSNTNHHPAPHRAHLANSTPTSTTSSSNTDSLKPQNTSRKRLVKIHASNPQVTIYLRSSVNTHVPHNRKLSRFLRCIPRYHHLPSMKPLQLWKLMRNH